MKPGRTPTATPSAYSCRQPRDLLTVAPPPPLHHGSRPSSSKAVAAKHTKTPPLRCRALQRLAAPSRTDLPQRRWLNHRFHAAGFLTPRPTVASSSPAFPDGSDGVVRLPTNSSPSQIKCSKKQSILALDRTNSGDAPPCSLAGVDQTRSEHPEPSDLP